MRWMGRRTREERRNERQNRPIATIIATYAVLQQIVIETGAIPNCVCHSKSALGHLSANQREPSLTLSQRQVFEKVGARRARKSDLCRINSEG